MPKKSGILIAHVPVIHKGYLQFFKANPKHRLLYIVGPDILKEFDYIRKDLRSLDPEAVADIIGAQDWFDEIHILTKNDLRLLNSDGLDIVMPDDDIAEFIESKLPKPSITKYPVFLRWDRRTVEGIDKHDSVEQISKSKLAHEFIDQASATSLKSSDIWRRVGAVLQTKDGKTIFTHSNQGEPSPYSPWIEGDPRNIFNRGVGIEMSVFSHAEATIIAEAAKRGVKTKGSKIYVTTFPCPACAKLIAHSGTSACYYSEGYAVLDGKRVMEDYGVKIYKIKTDIEDKTHPDAWVPYKKSNP